MIRAILTLLLFATPLAFTQVEKQDVEREKAMREKAAAVQSDTSTAEGWKHTMVTGANLAQASYTNWVAGGENSIAYSLFLRGGSELDLVEYDWVNSYRFMFGQANLSRQGARKTDDEIYLETLLMYKLGTHINPYASMTLRTQFAPGYLYDNAGVATQVSTFFDPGYWTQSAGVAYRPVPPVVSRLGIAARWIITSEYTQYSNDPGTDEIEKLRILGGIEWVTSVDWTVMENTRLISQVEVLSPFIAPDELLARFDAALNAKVNRYITASLSVGVINDWTTKSRRTQVRESVALGLSYSIL